VELGYGLGLVGAVSVGDGVELSVGDGELPDDGVVVSEGDAAAEPEGVAEDAALALFVMKAAVSTEFPGTEPQVALAFMPAAGAAWAGRDEPKVQKAMIVNPAAACSAARLANSILTSASSSSQVHWQSGA
jgi:hypothetical protein